MIEINDVTYKDILKNLTMKLPKACNYIKGDNGAGKTTLLDCMSQLNQSYSGTIRGNASTVYLNQHLYFSERLKLRDFVQFVFTLEGIKNYKTVFFAQADQYGFKKEIDTYWTKRMGSLSGGERRKLYFATVSCIERDWYLFDEPFAGVDQKGKAFMATQCNRLVEAGKGVVITSHESEPLQEMVSVKEHALT